MTALDITLLVLAGGLGAGARYLIDGLIMKGRKDAFPLGVFVINVAGAFLLGLLVGFGTLIAPAWVTIVGTGLLGGFTTFSTVSVESVLLAQRGRRDWAWINLLGTLLAAVLAAGLGLMLGGLLPR